MIGPAEGEALRRLIQNARNATGYLRDAAREGRVIEFRQRDELVMAIHDALDAVAALAPLSGPVDASGEPEDSLHTGDDERLDALTGLCAGLEALSDPDADVTVESLLADLDGLDALIVATIQRERREGGKIATRDDIKDIYAEGLQVGLSLRAAAVPSSPDEPICKCGSIMVCPDIGCDENKAVPSSPAQEQLRETVDAFLTVLKCSDGLEGAFDAAVEKMTVALRRDVLSDRAIWSGFEPPTTQAQTPRRSIGLSYQTNEPTMLLRSSPARRSESE